MEFDRKLYVTGTGVLKPDCTGIISRHDCHNGQYSSCISSSEFHLTYEMFAFCSSLQGLLQDCYLYFTFCIDSYCLMSGLPELFA